MGESVVGEQVEGLRRGERRSWIRGAGEYWESIGFVWKNIGCVE